MVNLITPDILLIYFFCLVPYPYTLVVLSIDNKWKNFQITKPKTIIFAGIFSRAGVVTAVMYMYRQ